MVDGEIYNEKELLLRIAEGDALAFESVFDHYRPVIYTLALRYTGFVWMAEEVVQDVFLKVWLKRALLPGIDNFGGWLYTIAQGFTINAAKKAGREKSKTLEWEQSNNIPWQTIETTADEDKYRAILQEAVARLPQKQQQVYKLIKQEGLKREEAAERLNVSPETIKSNLDHALRNIRAWCMAQLDRSSALVFILLLLKKNN